jgi:hypothetical protein
LASGKAIGENGGKPRRRRKKSDELAKLRQAIINVAKATDEKIRLIWQELHDLRYGKQIEDDARDLEKRLRVK